MMIEVELLRGIRMTEAVNTMSPELVAKRDKLLAVLRGYRKVVVAFSGGIDSTVVAKAAFLALGDQATAVTADSASVPRAEIEDAKNLAEQIGITHRIVNTDEFEDPNYLRNDGSRCYHCKSELYSRIESILPELGNPVICSGANLDDEGDYRPGLTAAKEHAVRHPLQEAGFTKADVRALAHSWDLPTWDKPASPCLSSRLAPGVPVTTERTARIEAAELYLRSLGIRECRVRLHHDELARIEVPLEALAALATPEQREALAARFRELGFRFITLDLEGFRSGNLNVLVSLDQKRLFTKGAEPASAAD
jgi:pyridinium-3,5-biscarboxylic acid mononucleotide sulfurtransferase